ncbi:MAG: hypothetical protein M3R32_03775 [Chloroflexota bacterium]|nr:hypothetical protein [Chloroflexota bacterium]
MNLINTDGLALIGAGSEWFWTALQFTALAITFLAIYRQLGTQQLEIREQTKLLRSQAHYNALSLSQRAREVLIENEDFVSVMNVGWATPEALSQDDWTRCSVYMFMQLNAWKYLYYQHREDAIPTEYWAGAEAYYGNLVATNPGYARFWSDNRISFDEPFRSYAARELTRNRASTLPPTVAATS